MIENSPLSFLCLVCCLLIALFSLSQLGSGRRRLCEVDVEHEVGHGIWFSPAQSDALPILMHAGMCVMFLLMSNMTFCMTALGTAASW